MQDNLSDIVVGRLNGAYGVRGWLKLQSYTRPKQNILEYSPWRIKQSEAWQQIDIEETQQRGDRLLVKLKGVDSPEQARQYSNCDIAITRTQLPPLDDGEYYWHDLIGLSVSNQDDIKLGTITEIVETGANDVLVIIDENDKRILIPLIMDVFVKQVDLAAGRLKVEWQIDDELSD